MVASASGVPAGSILDRHGWCEYGIELRTLEAEDLKTALRHYQDFFAEAGVQDALWLLQDPATVDDATVLPLVLQQSWTRQVTLFSSNLAHVRRGAVRSRR